MGRVGAGEGHGGDSYPRVSHGFPVAFVPYLVHPAMMFLLIDGSHFASTVSFFCDPNGNVCYFGEQASQVTTVSQHLVFIPVLYFLVQCSLNSYFGALYYN